jgi:hypothetical protein
MDNFFQNIINKISELPLEEQNKLKTFEGALSFVNNDFLANVSDEDDMKTMYNTFSDSEKLHEYNKEVYENIKDNINMDTLSTMDTTTFISMAKLVFPKYDDDKFDILKNIIEDTHSDNYSDMVSNMMSKLQKVNYPDNKQIIIDSSDDDCEYIGKKVEDIDINNEMEGPD